ncbi:MAG: hypothetical protein Q9208_002819 [Pyrenodesmia sp. 3 TL-2023]
MLLTPLPTAGVHTSLHPLRIPPPPYHLNPRRQQTSPVSSALQTTCRELQSLIASTHRPLRPSSSHPSTTTTTSFLPPHTSASLQSPIEFRRDHLPSWRAQASSKVRKPTQKALRNTCRANKPLHISMPRRSNVGSDGADQEGKENQAPTTPVTGSCAPPVMPLGLEKGDFEALGEEGRPAEGVLEYAMVEGGMRGVEGRRTELSRCDEVVVGALLRGMRLQRWQGRSGGR